MRDLAKHWAGAAINRQISRTASLMAPLVGFAALWVSTLASAADNNLRPSEFLESRDLVVIQEINKAIRQGWEDAEVLPARPATDGEWCRRVYLDLIGRVPSRDECEQFVSDKSKDKRARLVEELMTSEKYLDDFVENWTTIWTNLLIGRTGGMNRRDLVDRQGLQQYLRRAFQRNKSYAELVTDLVSATGSNAPGMDDFNGAVNFVLDNLEDNAVNATAKTARLFLGLQVQCTQCHDHPFNEWKQDQFWSMNAFFRQVRGERLGMRGGQGEARLVDQDFMGEDSRSVAEAEIYFERRNNEMSVAYPVFVDGTEISRNGSVNEVNRRKELARLITSSDYMNQSILNRLWGHFLGYGFTKPVDDMGPHNIPSHPELLKRLGDEFRGADWDLRRAMKWIALSEAYSLSSRIDGRNSKDDPTLGEPPLFSHFYLRQMSAEQLYQSLLTATQIEESARGTAEARSQRLNDWLQQFTIAFGTDDGTEATTFNGTIPQTLMMMNGDLINDAVKFEKGTLLYQVASDPKLKDATQKVSYLYMAAYSRKPSRKELDLANEVFKSRGGDGVAAIQDVWWVLLNSNEFILIH
jgi:hypothetical protein